MINEESINEICRQIREDGEREVESILDKARKTVESIKEKAHREGERASQEILREAHARAETIKKKVLSSVTLDVKREKLRLREELFKEVLTMVKEKLGALRESDRYPGILKSLVMEAIEALGKDRLTIYADRRDIELVKSKVIPLVLEEAAGAGIPIDSVEVAPIDRPVIGGVMVGVTGGNVIFDNTFDSRIYRLESQIRGKVYREICLD